MLRSYALSKLNYTGHLVILEYKLDYKSRGKKAQNSPFILRFLGYKTIRDAVYVRKS